MISSNFQGLIYYDNNIIFYTHILELLYWKKETRCVQCNDFSIWSEQLTKGLR